MGALGHLYMIDFTRHSVYMEYIVVFEISYTTTLFSISDHRFLFALASHNTEGYASAIKG